MADIESGPPPGYGEEPHADLSIEQKNKLNFSEQSIRSAFVKKVFILVSVMLFICTMMCSIPFMSTGYRQWLTGCYQDFQYCDYSSSFWVYLTSIIVFMVIAIVLSCIPALSRKSPLNLILLCVFTVAAGFMTSCICAFYTISSVLICFAITTAICVAIVIFAIFVRKDLTTMIGFMFLFGVWILFFGISAAFWGIFWQTNFSFLWVLYGALSAIFFMLWLAIDVQLIMGNRKYAISPEDYVFAAMRIFLDVLNIFLYILMIFGRVK